MPELDIPEHIKSGGELIIKADKEISFVHVYESPRQKFDPEDKKQEHPFWRGDIYETTHSDNFKSDTEVHLTMKRGPDNKPALYGNYLVKVGFSDGKEVEKFLIVDPQ